MKFKRLQFMLPDIRETTHKKNHTKCKRKIEFLTMRKAANLHLTQDQLSFLKKI